MTVLSTLNRRMSVLAGALGATLAMLATLLALPHSSSASGALQDTSKVAAGEVATVSGAATQCDIQFSDVPEDSTFYSFITCLACGQVISGYTDGTFGPGNNVTRGQLSKIVANSASFDDELGPQIFEDIPPGSPYYSFIDSLATRGYIGGYPCGAVGEPCVQPLQRSYFRPNGAASRGQIAKIVSNAAGFDDDPGTQLYQDVAPGSPFYEWVQRLGRRGIIGGYPCGGAGETCVSPANRPYFRPGANTSRGQLAKIVSNTFFSSCFYVSAGDVTLAGVSETTFNPLSGVALFEVSGATFLADPAVVRVFNNQVMLDQSLVHVSAQVISVTNSLQEGRNDLMLIAENAEGRELSLNATVWAGNQVLNITALDENGDPTKDATITARLADDSEVFATGTTETEIDSLSFSNIPDRTIILEASANGNLLHGTLAITGDAGNVTLQMVGFGPASNIDNNDFHLGTEGWNVGGAPVSLVPHTDDEEEATPGKSALKGAGSAPTEDLDLQLSTQDEGPQSVSRTFHTEEGITSVTVRYRFITSEVPGGYFGTKYNDYFNVSIRSQGGGGVSSESNAMNGLGLGAFDGQGATGWREETLSVNEAGDVVQIDVTVGNVADGAFDSSVVIAAVTGGKLSITDVTLNDIDDLPLKFFSASLHPYFSGFTRIHGTIRIKGDPTDSLKSLEILVIRAGHIVATGRLPYALRSKLLASFGSGGVIELTTSQFLFAVPAYDLTELDTNKETTVYFKVKATSTKGETHAKQAGKAIVLVRYTHGKRYGDEHDEEQGGDDWIRPSIRPVIMHFAGLETGDISNMNGGPFLDPDPDKNHTTHLDGTHVDAWYAGYDYLNAAVARKMISLLNDDTYGSRILVVFVAYSKSDSDPFWNAIVDVQLDDGRWAKNVIIPDSDHDDHFHWGLSTGP